MSLEVREKVKNENCVIKFILKEWQKDRLYSDRNEISQILMASRKIHVKYAALCMSKCSEFFACCLFTFQSLFDFDSVKSNNITLF